MTSSPHKTYYSHTSCTGDRWILTWKAKMQQLLTLQVNRCCILALQSRIRNLHCGAQRPFYNDRHLAMTAAKFTFCHQIYSYCVQKETSVAAHCSNCLVMSHHSPLKIQQTVILKTNLLSCVRVQTYASNYTEEKKNVCLFHHKIHNIIL